MKVMNSRSQEIENGYCPLRKEGASHFGIPGSGRGRGFRILFAMLSLPGPFLFL